MSDLDIVDVLRSVGGWPDEAARQHFSCGDIADEIERLRAELERLQRDAERWQQVKRFVEVAPSMLNYFSWTYRMKPTSRLNANDMDQLAGQDQEFSLWINNLSDASIAIDAAIAASKGQGTEAAE